MILLGEQAYLALKISELSSLRERHRLGEEFGKAELAVYDARHRLEVHVRDDGC